MKLLRHRQPRMTFPVFTISGLVQPGNESLSCQKCHRYLVFKIIIVLFRLMELSTQYSETWKIHC